jgi:predicted cupin superfamily sugar epimerase
MVNAAPNSPRMSVEDALANSTQTQTPINNTKQTSIVTIDDLALQLKLTRHPEGGFFAETLRSDVSVEFDINCNSNSNVDVQNANSIVRRSASTAILFAMTGRDFSAFHRIRSDEVWHFYYGSPIEVLVIDADTGALASTLLGPFLTPGTRCQFVVKRNQWFASRLAQSHLKSLDDVALVGCTVAPGFDFADFELAKRDELIAAHPQHADTIRALTRE